MFDDIYSEVRFLRLRDIPTFSEPRCQTFCQVNLRLKKTWHATCFKPQSEEEIIRKQTVSLLDSRPRQGTYSFTCNIFKQKQLKSQKICGHNLNSKIESKFECQFRSNLDFNNKIVSTIVIWIKF